MASFIFSVYTLFAYLKKPTLKRALGHAFASGLVVAVRVLGLMVPFLTVFFVGIDLFTEKTNHLRKRALLLVFYLVFFFAFLVLFWPYLWHHPLSNFWEAFRTMSAFTWWVNTVLYRGDLVLSTKLPWHYLPTWIGITTPITYLVFFASGSLACFISFVKKPLSFLKENRELTVFLVWAFAPVTLIILLNSVVYDGWRQVYFIYPAIVALSVQGFTKVKNLLHHPRVVRYQVLLLSLLLVLLSLQLIQTTYTMIRLHPYQNVYFNALVGGLKNAKGSYEMDYWGLSFAESLRFLLSYQPEGEVIVCPSGTGGVSASLILTKEERARLKFVKTPEEADYFFSNYRWHEELPPNQYKWSGHTRTYESKIYEVLVDGAAIGVVYKL